MINYHLSSRGQVLIIFVVAIVGLIGMTGLAIDGGNIYSDRRHAQNAADTAAMAAALTRNTWAKNNSVCKDTIDTSVPILPTCSPDTVTSAMNIAERNGYDSNPAHQNRVDVYSPPTDGPYSVCDPANLDFDCHDYIQVVINDDVNTWFAKVLGIRTMHNRVSAVALAKYKPETSYYGGNTLVELYTGHSSCPSDFNVGGSGTVNLIGGGIFVNSTNANCAYKQTSCTADVQLNGDPQASIQVVGGAAVSHCSSELPITPATTHYDFPPDPLIKDVPVECSQAPATSSTVGGVTTYYPGRYAGTFPVVNGPSILTPGVYCVDDFKTTKDITGSEVMIYMPPTGQVDISGGGSGTSDPNIVLTPPSSGPYVGFLIYGAYDNTSHFHTCTIAGASGTEYSGMIWVPYCYMNISGNSTSNGIESQIIAGTMSLSGDLNLTFRYNADKLPKDKEISNISLPR